MEDDKDRKERERDSWQYRAVRLTRGPQSKIGAVLLAILGKQRNTCPQFGNAAEITKSGFVCTSMIRKNGDCVFSAIGKADEMVGGFRKLADILKLTDPERIEMFQKLQAWISKDDRVVRDWSHREGT